MIVIGILIMFYGIGVLFVGRLMVRRAHPLTRDYYERMVLLLAVFVMMTGWYCLRLGVKFNEFCTENKEKVVFPCKSC